jgi:hypothetical protein
LQAVGVGHRGRVRVTEDPGWARGDWSVLCGFVGLVSSSC